VTLRRKWRLPDDACVGSNRVIICRGGVKEIGVVLSLSNMRDAFGGGPRGGLPGPYTNDAVTLDVSIEGASVD